MAEEGGVEEQVVVGIVTAGERGVVGSKVCVRLFLLSVYVCVC